MQTSEHEMQDAAQKNALSAETQNNETDMTFDGEIKIERKNSLEA